MAKTAKAASKPKSARPRLYRAPPKHLGPSPTDWHDGSSHPADGQTVEINSGGNIMSGYYANGRWYRSHDSAETSVNGWRPVAK